ncbi:CHC2 zinc finger domain-containing protein [Microbaculum sp. FT89]|uniref:CHC2 zinc finger domain-containing protein n=1 Tax=Microbaculum sp. FT89 TaxID=3447298 RepID=UPI003F52954D
MPAQRVDFKFVREHADFEAVFTHYGIALEKDGTKAGQFKAICPFHEDHKPSLKINTERNLYNCFPCDAGGNILEFVKAMEGSDNLRDAAITLASICGIETAPGHGHKPKSERGQGARRSKSNAERRTPQSAKNGAAAPYSAESDAPSASEQHEESEEDGVPYNRPLTFELKNLELEHPFFTERGITPELIEAFGLGIATRGMMKGRLVIPIHNARGELVAYCGRFPADVAPEDEPKYKLPPGFRKELELFNLHRAAARMRDEHTGVLVVVESYFSAMRLDRIGIPTVSPMGRSISPQQVELVASLQPSRIIVMFDGDEPGRKGALSVAAELVATHTYVRAAEVPDGFKPHRAPEQELFELLQRLTEDVLPSPTEH